MPEAILHVYDVLVPNNDNYSAAIKTLNNVLVGMSVGGILHGAIEGTDKMNAHAHTTTTHTHTINTHTPSTVYGYEYSFGYCPEGTGVYRCPPAQNPMVCIQWSRRLTDNLAMVACTSFPSNHETHLNRIPPHPTVSAPQYSQPGRHSRHGS